MAAHCATGVFPAPARTAGAQSADRRTARQSVDRRRVAGSGDRTTDRFGKSLPDTYPSAGIRTAPRLGFGWDVFGDGKTAVRGGFGTSYNRLGDGQYGGFTGVISRTVSLQWTTIDDRFNAPSLENPLGGTIVQEETDRVPTEWSIGVQRDAVGRRRTWPTWAIPCGTPRGQSGRPPPTAQAPTRLLAIRRRPIDGRRARTADQPDSSQHRARRLTSAMFMDEIYRLHAFQMTSPRPLGSGLGRNYPGRSPNSTKAMRFRSAEGTKLEKPQERQPAHN